MKLPGSVARTRPLLFSGTILSNLVNKIQFTFEVVPCLIFRRFFRRCAPISAQSYKGVGGWEAGRREGVGGVGREEAKAPQVKTRGPELLTDGPDHTTRSAKGHSSGQG